MAETKYTQAQMDDLIATDTFLRREAKDKYTDYKSKDPFPKVGEALLNSVDLLMYILTVGIVEPFNVNNLKGVTYACTFSGEAHYYDTKLGEMVEKILNDDEELELEQNSITYLKIEEKFRVPEYMALRFNVSVSNAYKGLLVGTGPIIDPGFEGNVFIPLHNLTANKYVIKKGASLIRVEFTKLSRHIDWNNKRINLFPKFNPVTKKTPEYSSFYYSIADALLDSDKKKFYASGGGASVRSSIPDAIAESAEQAAEAHNNAESSANDAKAAAETAENLSNKIRTWSIIGIMGALIAVAALIISVFALIQDTNIRYDGIVKEIKDYKQQNYTLEQKIEMLQEKLEQYETMQSQSSEKQSENNTSDETENFARSSPN